MRIGSGFDVHRLDVGEGVTLGGLWIPCPYRLIAHSDGDVVLHALMDAMLGALALGDIGQLFPDTAEAYRGADSRELLAVVLDRCADAGFLVHNVDITILCERPKISPVRAQMRQTISTLLGVAVDAVSVKATTTERLGFLGRGEGIAVMVSCLMVECDT